MLLANKIAIKTYHFPNILFLFIHIILGTDVLIIDFSFVVIKLDSSLQMAK